jgi:hypothetical protein
MPRVKQTINPLALKLQENCDWTESEHSQARHCGHEAHLGQEHVTNHFVFYCRHQRHDDLSVSAEVHGRADPGQR